MHDDDWSLLDHALLSSANACACEIISPVTDEELSQRKLLLEYGTRNVYMRSALNTKEVLEMLPQKLLRKHESLGTDQADAGALGVAPGAQILLKYIASHSKRGRSAKGVSHDHLVWHDSHEIIQGVIQTGERCCLDELIAPPNDPEGCMSMVYCLYWEPNKANTGGAAAIVVRILFAPREEMEELLSVAGITHPVSNVSNVNLHVACSSISRNAFLF
jgi:hypothetical protein